MGVPAIGGDITGAVTEDSGVSATGDLDDVGFLAGNADDTWSISADPAFGVASIDPITGEWTYTLNDANPTVNALDAGETLVDTFTVLLVDDDGGTDTQDVTIIITGVVCFASGTRIEMKDKFVPIEALKPGDLVRVEDGYSPVLWAGHLTLDRADLLENEKLRPIRIKAGALGRGVPAADLFVSRQHRILVDTPVARAMFGTSKVFVAAAKLTDLPGIDVDDRLDHVTYHHLLFAKHEVIFAEGAPAESLYTGPEVFKMVDPRARQEILAVLPYLATPDNDVTPAHPIPSGKQQKALVARHLETSEPIICMAVAELY